jgi:Ni,Fe-hydrogenase III large subunit
MSFPLEQQSLDAQGWLSALASAGEQGGRLGALWGSDEPLAVHALVVLHGGLLCLHHEVRGDAYPDASTVFPYAARMQRAIRDLLGLRAGDDERGWLRHGAWREDVFPLRRAVALNSTLPTGEGRYAFVRVEGEGAHEVPVGPVHAGIIEPGHFRFSVVGERVLRLEERLGYVHKGIEKRFESLTLSEGARLAGRVSGDSTVAFAWAYAMALENAAGARPPRRALWLRALLLERERIANHLGDLGALGNDGGLAFGLAQFSRLKEDFLRMNARLFGHRYLMDRVVAGGVCVDLDAAARDALSEEASRLEAEVRALRTIYYDHPGLQDRCITCGQLAPRLAAELGVVGLAARASANAIDARVYPGLAPYDELEPALCAHGNGDVASRIVVRFDEIFESLRLQRRIASSLPAGEQAIPVSEPPEKAFGVGWVEGWRGEVFVALEAGGGGRVRRCHPHDPSWQNWPALEHAVLGNIVPDFPLINKSFNLSYSGVDL